MTDKLEAIKKDIDEVFYSVPQPSALKERYEKEWDRIITKENNNG